MELVQPIKDRNTIDKFKAELLKKSSKDYMLFDIAINIGLKITDIINLTVWDVKNKSQVVIKDDITKKTKSFSISPAICEEINKFIAGMSSGELLFASKKGGKKPITKLQAYKSLNEVGHKLGIDAVGTHTLRKTFGYHHYQKYNDILLLQDIFSHATPGITLRYIGMDDDMKDSTIEDFFI
jgi:integrase